MKSGSVRTDAGEHCRVIALSGAGLGGYRRARPRWYEALWMAVEFALVSNPLQPSSRLRSLALRFFGARVGSRVILRPRMRVKFPWNLEIGDDCWIGEGVWFHNQDRVSVGHDTVISQETFITTGSHDFRRTMDLVTAPIAIGSGVWITSRCVVTLGVSIGDCVLVLPGSVVNRSLEPGNMYGGVPARFIGPRFD